jgi:hypothetical protein
MPNPLFPTSEIPPERKRKLFEELSKPYQELQPQEEGIVIAPSFISNPKDYIGIPQYNVVIAKREEIHKKNFNTTLDKIKHKNVKFFMPPIPYFMQHFFNVREAAHNPEKPLYDGERNPLPQEEAQNLWKYFTSKNREQFGDTPKEKICWTWLNAKFTKGTGFNGLDIETFNVPNYPQRQLLEQCLWQDTYVSIDPDEFNKQGLPKQTIATQDNYKEGENIRFWYPRPNHVARFDTGSNWADLDSYRDPDGEGPALGVFLCAEGVAPNFSNSGGIP